MKKSYRVAQETNYINALKSVGIRETKVTAHRDGSATIRTNAKASERIKSIPGVEVIAEGATEITITVPTALEYHMANPPLFTAEEKAAMEAEKAARKRERASKKGVTVILDDEDEDEAE